MIPDLAALQANIDVQHELGFLKGKVEVKNYADLSIVKDAAPYRVEMSGCFCPFRRDVDWRKARETPIKPLLDKLQFTTARRNWGFQLRFGLFEISEHDVIMIAAEMGVSLSQAGKNLPLIPLSQNRAVRHHP